MRTCRRTRSEDVVARPTLTAKDLFLLSTFSPKANKLTMLFTDVDSGVWMSLPYKVLMFLLLWVFSLKQY